MSGAGQDVGQRTVMTSCHPAAAGRAREEGLGWAEMGMHRSLIFFSPLRKKKRCNLFYFRLNIYFYFTYKYNTY